ncbi:MAG: hypothetical protein AAF628_20110 [Planctomycetota bacterium]
MRSTLATALAAVVPLVLGHLSSQSLLRDLNVSPESEVGSRPSLAVELGGHMYFTAFDAQHGRELWRTNGTAGGAELVIDLMPGIGSAFAEATPMAASGGTLFFIPSQALGASLWKTDGTAQGTVELARFDKVEHEETRWIVAAPGGVYFVAAGGGAGLELWWSDVTAAGTTMVVDLNPNGDAFVSIFEPWLTVVGGTLFFVANDDVAGYELWRTDRVQTTLVANLAPGLEGSFPSQLTASTGVHAVGKGIAARVARAPWVRGEARHPVPRTDTTALVQSRGLSLKGLSAHAGLVGWQRRARQRPSFRTSAFEVTNGDGEASRAMPCAGKPWPKSCGSLGMGSGKPAPVAGSTAANGRWTWRKQPPPNGSGTGASASDSA